MITKHSRPKFWIYLAGPYLIGCAYFVDSVMQFFNLSFFAHAFFFLIPANIILYGVNDIYDREVDEKNKRKVTEEARVTQEGERKLKYAIFASFLYAFALLLINNLTASLILILFVVLSLFYSAKPLRFKTKPFLDFSSNILYFLPFVFVYAKFTNSIPPFSFMLLGYLWTSAMHLYSAAVDIKSDIDAGIKTSATVFGPKLSLVIVTVFWSLFSIMFIYFSDYNPLGMISFVYPFISVYTLKNHNRIDGIYKIFPIVNFTLGFCLFLYLLFL